MDHKTSSVLVSTLIKIMMHLKSHVQTANARHLLQAGDALVDINLVIIKQLVSIVRRKRRRARQLDTNKAE
jgi:hypothetical protein